MFASQASAPEAEGLVKDTTTKDFMIDVIQEVPQSTGSGRFLGTVVRSLQAARSGDREGRPRSRRQGEARQDEYRRAPLDCGPARHQEHSGGDRLRRRPADRRLRRRPAGEPDQGLHRSPHHAARRGEHQCDARTGGSLVRGRRPAGRGGSFRQCSGARTDRAPRSRRPHPHAGRGRRSRGREGNARLDPAGQAERSRLRCGAGPDRTGGERTGRRRDSRRSKRASRRTAAIIRRATILRSPSPQPGARKKPSSICSTSSARIGSGTRTPRAGSYCNCSRPGGQPTRRPWPDDVACRPFCSHSKG